MPRWIDIAIKTVHTNYDLFSNPLYRGPNFTWNKFPLLVGKMLWCQFFCYYHYRFPYWVIRPFSVALAYSMAWWISRNRRIK